MNLLALLDAIAVHAAAAAAQVDAKFYDVAVGYPAAKGRCVRIFYAGERVPERFEDEDTFKNHMVAQVVVVRAYWPLNETAAKRHRAIEGEMGTFVTQLRTRLHGDYALGGAAADGIRIYPTSSDQVVLANVQYAITNTEIVIDYDEFTWTP